ncbi:MAG: hypothetical protein ACRET2_06540 [Steroidobacteraceae bacterium]
MGFELSAEAIQVKLKLNQNHVDGNVRGVVEGLRAVGSAESSEVADWMEEALGQREAVAGGSGSKA